MTDLSSCQLLIALYTCRILPYSQLTTLISCFNAI